MIPNLPASCSSNLSSSLRSLNSRRVWCKPEGRFGGWILNNTILRNVHLHSQAIALNWDLCQMNRYGRVSWQRVVTTDIVSTGVDRDDKSTVSRNFIWHVLHRRCTASRPRVRSGDARIIYIIGSVVGCIDTAAHILAFLRFFRFFLLRLLFREVPLPQWDERVNLSTRAAVRLCRATNKYENVRIRHLRTDGEISICQDLRLGR
jgi:hypothetical protein